jgi:biotin carboxyl carrier protein
MRSYHIGILFLLTIILIISCGKKSEETESGKVTTRTQVTVTTVKTGTLSDSVALNAVAAYLQKSQIKATTAGFVRKILIRPGNHVKSNQILLSLVTKEAASIGTTLKKALEPELKFTGVIPVRADLHGVVAQINHAVGDYVQEGEPLVLIYDLRSLVFVMTVPYDLKYIFPLNRTMSLVLPDHTILIGTLYNVLPSADTLTQSVNAIIKVNTPELIPENILAHAKLLRVIRKNALWVPRTAVLSDAVQENFWVMKLIDTATAVKVPVVKGLEADDRIEILHSTLKQCDTVLTSGNYGMPDTAGVTILK